MNQERNYFGEYRRRTEDRVKKRPSSLSAAERAKMNAVKDAAHEAYMVVYREALRALGALEINRREYDRRLSEAKIAQYRAQHTAAEEIQSARQLKKVKFAQAG